MGLRTTDRLTLIRQRQIRRRDGAAKWAIGWLGLLAMLGFFAPWVASSVPWWVKVDGKSYWPLLNPSEQIFLRENPDQTSPLPIYPIQAMWPSQGVEAAWLAWVPYGVNGRAEDAPKLAPGTPYQRTNVGLAQAYPIQYRHWLGTDKQGRDVLALLIHGIRSSLGIALIAASLTWCLGIVIGGLAGYLQTQPSRLSRRELLLLLTLAGMVWFWGWKVWQPWLATRGFMLRSFWLLGLLVGSMAVLRLIRPKFAQLGLTWTPRDKPLKGSIGTWLDRLIEVLDALPSLLLLFILLAFLDRNQSRMGLMLFLSLIGWTGVARLARGEILALVKAPFIESAQALGYTRVRIFWHHLLPNIWPTLLVLWVILVGNMLLVESTLSFLALADGSPPSWGGMLGAAAGDTTYWWLSLSPGLMIFVTVLALNFLAEWYQDKINRGEDGRTQNPKKKKWLLGA